MDYEALRFIWWVLIGVLLIGFVVTDGFDMGVASLLKVIGRDNEERRIMINTVAPHWDGNQVWLITAAGALFAAWPTVYAAAFSGFYLAMMLTLFALFLRPIAFEYRSKIDNQPWRDRWDWALTVGSTVPPLIIGVALATCCRASRSILMSCCASITPATSGVCSTPLPYWWVCLPSSCLSTTAPPGCR